MIIAASIRLVELDRRGDADAVRAVDEVPELRKVHGAVARRV